MTYINMKKALPKFRENGFTANLEEGKFIPIENLGGGHLSCPRCQSPFFSLIKNGPDFCIGCSRCSYQALFRLPHNTKLLSE